MTKKKQKQREANIRRALSLLVNNRAVSAVGYSGDNFAQDKMTFQITIPTKLIPKK